ncbi:RSP_7527 family protein [Pontivivens ytuae]|uniref:Uncharacterized protein n=1 Tax=Pontivivens ytuae TaxID=2789856 RepID=A0A7S9LQI6_9RHOB|nr:hypothetical protein [Pontivivens ytuae]QPH53125.1 hypothetical protein I0K15_15145 [Pontivivens ytuae]
MNDLSYISDAELLAIRERAHQLRAQAVRDGLRAAREWVRGLFAGSARHA